MAIPAMPPTTLTTTASARNCMTMTCALAPSALRVPISRVRSVTLTSMMFIRAIEAPKSVMSAISAAPLLTELSDSMSIAEMLSLRRRLKLSSAPGFSRRTERMTTVARAIAASRASGDGAMTLIT